MQNYRLSPSRASDETNPAHSLILDFQFPETVYFCLKREKKKERQRQRQRQRQGDREEEKKRGERDEGWAVVLHNTLYSHHCRDFPFFPTEDMREGVEGTWNYTTNKTRRGGLCSEKKEGAQTLRVMGEWLRSQPLSKPKKRIWAKKFEIFVFNFLMPTNCKVELC
jgi:hypothetical protein